MKVICIDGSWQRENGDEPDTKMPQEGVVYTVVEIEVYPSGTFYILEELDPQDLFLADSFAPISDIDENEFERNYNKVYEKI